MTDFADLIGAHDALKAAERGDMAPLAARLEAGRLTVKESVWLARYLRGEHKRKRGRKPAIQQGNKSDLKKSFQNNLEIDLHAWDAVRYLERWEGKTEVQAKDEIASILGETPKNTGYRLKRVDAHFAAGKSRADFMPEGIARTVEMILEALRPFSKSGVARQLAEILPGGEETPQNLPLLLALDRK